MIRDFSAFPPLGIRAYSDFYTIPEPKVWGDYWLKESLTQEFLRLGYPVDHADPKVLLHLFGEPLNNISPSVYSILWIHSHPDWINRRVLGDYRKIYCISGHFIRKIRAMGFEAEPLMLPTAMTPLMAEKKYDIVFVGNTKQNRVRKIISDLGSPPCSLKIWGWGWRGLIPDEWYGGEYYENSRLNVLYAASKIVLNDHHDDMQREGFINPRILDVLASGGFVISDRVLGIEEMFGHSVPTYESPEDLRELILQCLADDERRSSIALRGQRIALQYTFTAVCRKIIEHITSIF